MTSVKTREGGSRTNELDRQSITEIQVQVSNKKQPKLTNRGLYLSTILLALRRFTGKELRVNKWHNTSLRDDDVTQQLVQSKTN